MWRRCNVPESPNTWFLSRREIEWLELFDSPWLRNSRNDDLMLVLSQCYSVAMTHDDHITTDTQPLAINSQRNRLFMIYNGYRIVLALVLLSLEIFQSTPLTLGSASAPSQSVELFNLGLLLILVSGLIVFFNRVDKKPESDTRFLMI